MFRSEFYSSRYRCAHRHRPPATSGNDAEIRDPDPDFGGNRHPRTYLSRHASAVESLWVAKTRGELLRVIRGQRVKTEFSDFTIS